MQTAKVTIRLCPAVQCCAGLKSPGNRNLSLHPAMRTVVLSIAFCLCIVGCFAQEAMDESMDLQRFTDEMVGAQDEDVNYEDLYENLLQTLSSPYDLNNVSEEELKSLHLLTDLQIENFITYRHEQGALLDVHELQVIPGFDLSLVARLL